jgi:hypothetical protein
MLRMTHLRVDLPSPGQHRAGHATALPLIIDSCTDNLMGVGIPRQQPHWLAIDHGPQMFHLGHYPHVMQRHTLGQISSRPCDAPAKVLLAMRVAPDLLQLLGRLRQDVAVVVLVASERSAIGYVPSISALLGERTKIS